MGRPLNKKFFAGLATAGFQIGCTARFTGGAEEAAYIVEQVSTHKYLVVDEATELKSQVMTMVADPGTLAVGQMAVTVDPDSTDTLEYAKVIKAHQVITWEGNRYAWPITGGDRGGLPEADLQETTT